LSRFFFFSPCHSTCSHTTKVAENNWWFRSEANWKDEEGCGPFHWVKLTFIGEAPQDSDAAKDFKAAEKNLKNLIEKAANADVSTEGGFTDQGLKIRHGIFGVSRFHPDYDHSH